MVTLRAIVRVTPSRRSIMSYISHVAILLLYVSAVVAIAPCPVTLPGNQACGWCKQESDLEWSIDCSNKNLGSFPQIETDIIIKRLFLHSNNISQITISDLSKIAGVRQLDLSGNRISSTEFLTSTKFALLHTLSMNENRFNNSAVRTSHFSNLTELNNLEMSNSLLKNLDFLRDGNRVSSHLASLERLILDYNELTTVDSDVFNGKVNLRTVEARECGNQSVNFLRSSSLSNLQHLRLQRNSISAINSGDIKFLSSVKNFKLNGNLLTTLSEDVMDKLPAIEDLDLLSNPVACGCHIAWIQEWNAANGDKIKYPSNLESCAEFINPQACSGNTSSTSGTTNPVTFPQTTTTMWSTTSPATSSTSGTTNPVTFPQTTTTMWSTTSPAGGMPLTTIIIISVAAGASLLIIIIVIVVVMFVRKRRAREKENIYKYQKQADPQNSNPAAKQDGGDITGRPLPLPGDNNVDDDGYTVPGEDKYGYFVPNEEEMRRHEKSDPLAPNVDQNGYQVPQTLQLENKTSKVDGNGYLIPEAGPSPQEGRTDQNGYLIPQSPTGVYLQPSGRLPKASFKSNNYVEFNQDDENHYEVLPEPREDDPNNYTKLDPRTSTGYELAVSVPEENTKQDDHQYETLRKEHGVSNDAYYVDTPL